MLKSRPNRQGFTLVELLVVISIITTLAALAVFIVPALLQSDAAARGGANVQGSLFIARMQALRDRRGVGIRLIRDVNDPNRVTAIQYIEKPDDFSGTVQINNMTPTQATMNPDPTGGFPDPSLYLVQPGDFIQVPTFPNDSPFRQILTVAPGTIMVNSTNPFSVSGTQSALVARSPRPVRGEDVIPLPDGVIIDMLGGRSILTAENNGNLDILFAPSGIVLGTASRDAKIVLWIRDEREDITTSPNQTLIVIFTKTGLISSYPVDISGNPYSFIDDPRAAGF